MFFSVSHIAFWSYLGINSHLVPLVVTTDTIKLYMYKDYINTSAAVNLSCVMSTFLALLLLPSSYTRSLSFVH